MTNDPQQQPAREGHQSTHYGSNGAAECGASSGPLTLAPDVVTCSTCRGWLPIVAPDQQQPYSVQQQPPPSASDPEPLSPREYLGSILPLADPAPSTGATAGGVSVEEEAVCHCGLSSFDQTDEARHLRAEVARLRADLKEANESVAALLKIVTEELPTVTAQRDQAQAERDNWAEGCGVDHIQRIKALSAQVEAMRGVVETIANPLNSEWWSRDKARAALDQQQQEEVRE